MAGEEEARALTRIVLRPFGSPLPIGFFAFGVGVLLTSLQELGALPPTEARLVALIGLCFCVPLELLAAVIAFLARDGAGGTILGLFGTSWAVSAAVMLTRPPPATSPTLGVFYLFLTAVCVLIAAAAMTAKPFFGVLLIVAAARFALVGAYQLAHVDLLRSIAGIVGVALTVVALYGGEALLVEDTQGRTVLPLFRRQRARAAIEGDLDDQLKQVTREPGVRHQL
jgi:uncharacterized protein